MPTLTVKDQYIYLIEEATSISEDEKEALIAALEQGMTPELKEKLIALFESEERSIDESIRVREEALSEYRAEFDRDAADDAETTSLVEAQTAEEMAQVTKDFNQTSMNLENEFATSVEQSTKAVESTEMDAIRAQLGIQK